MDEEIVKELKDSIRFNRWLIVGLAVLFVCLLYIVNGMYSDLLELYQTQPLDTVELKPLWQA